MSDENTSCPSSRAALPIEHEPANSSKIFSLRIFVSGYVLVGEGYKDSVVRSKRATERQVILELHRIQVGCRYSYLIASASVVGRYQSLGEETLLEHVVHVSRSVTAMRCQRRKNYAAIIPVLWFASRITYLIKRRLVVSVRQRKLGDRRAYFPVRDLERHVKAGGLVIGGHTVVR